MTDLVEQSSKLVAVSEEIAKKPAPTVHKAELVDGCLKLECTEGQAHALEGAFGTSSKAFQDYAFGQALNILKAGKAEGDLTVQVNSIFAMLAGIDPQTELEAMLAAQMVATHHLAMDQLRKHACAQLLERHDLHANLANKFLRTFTTQVEALSRMRRGGKQIVEHVHVGAGGQAVIAGTVNTGGTGGQ